MIIVIIEFITLLFIITFYIITLKINKKFINCFVSSF